jgi:type III pantothenate kinase
MNAWLFDLGNSRLKCAPLRGDGGVASEGMLEVAHDGIAFDDALALLPARFDSAFVASVANPELTTTLLDELTRRCARITRARTQSTSAGVRIAYADPQRLGVDRFLALLAAHARAPQPWLVVGVGTALTIDLLDAGGRHHGGRIAPSPTLMREALHRRAPQLPVSGGQATDFADDTGDALASGCEGAALALIGDSRARARQRLGTAPRVLLHGGGAPALAPGLADAVQAPALVLEGLARWIASLAPANVPPGA